MLIIAIGIYLIITFLVTVIGIEWHSEGLKIFLLSLFLTPLYGLFLLFKVKHKAVRIHYYYCEECEYIYPVKLKHCPICQEKGKKVKLIKFENPHKLTKLYKRLSLA
ncbi:MAG: hypothetical protein IEMM0006_1429 [bacterium]|nr:MAG: hypothetical protein IEMM0006_1429 [bacterium]